MDVQHHKITATSAGHEGHDGVYHCHRCGWPFPKPHPSSKHRRAHKRVCGTIEGYKIIQSEHHDDHLAVSDDDQASDDDEHHTPSPNIVEKNAESGGRGIVGEKSFKSEHDVFSDAVMDFPDSGMSPQSEERSESVSKSVESDLYGSRALEVEEAADRPEQYNDARSEELSTPGTVANGNNYTDKVVPISIAAEVVSVGVTEDPQREHDDNVQVQEHDSSSVSLESAEGTVLDQTKAAGESRDEIQEKFISEVAKDDSPPPPSESLQDGAYEEVDSVVHSTEISTSTKTFTDEAHGSIDSVWNKEVSHSTKNIGSTESVGENTLPEECLVSTSLVKPNESTETLDVTKHSDVAFIDKGKMPKTSLDSVDVSEQDKFDMTGGSENESLESKNLNLVDSNSSLGSTYNVFPCEDNNSTMGKKDVDHGEEFAKGAASETGNEKSEEASVGVEAIPDSTIPSEKPTDSAFSRELDSDANSLQEVSEHNPSLLESKDDNFDKSVQGDGADKVTEVLQSVAGAGSEVSEGGDACDNGSFPMSSVEHTESPVTSELQNNNHVETKGVKVESLDVAETVSKLEDDNGGLVSESIRLLSGSGLLSESSANDGSSAGEDHKASESIAIVEENHESNIESTKFSESSTPSVQEEAFPTSQCLDATSLDANQKLSSDEFRTSKSVDIITGAEHTLEQLECSESLDAPSLKQPVPSPSDVEDFPSDTVDDKAVTDVVDIIRVDSNSMTTEADYKPTKQTDDPSASDVSGSLISRSESLEANCGSVVSDTLETNSQKHKTQSEKSDTYEPPSFMTLVQSGNEVDHKVSAATEIETVQNHQQPKSDALQAGWFPSLTNVVNDSEGRKKNEEIIAKVTNWSPVKQQHGPLKSLLNEVKSPTTKQDPTANHKAEAETKNGNVGFVPAASETHTTKDQDTNKHVEEWNSPARYPIEIKKEKKKGKSFWGPFVCCSSAHRDL